MAFTPGSTSINTNDTTDVDVVGAPAASTQRVVRNITVYNNDTVDATVTLKRDHSGTEFVLYKTTLVAGESLLYDVVQVLDATTEKIQAVLSGAITTNQLHCTSNYADYS